MCARGEAGRSRTRIRRTRALSAKDRTATSKRPERGASRRCRERLDHLPACRERGRALRLRAAIDDTVPAASRKVTTADPTRESRATAGTRPARPGPRRHLRGVTDSLRVQRASPPGRVSGPVIKQRPPPSHPHRWRAAGGRRAVAGRGASRRWGMSPGTASRPVRRGASRHRWGRGAPGRCQDLRGRAFADPEPARGRRSPKNPVLARRRLPGERLSQKSFNYVPPGARARPTRCPGPREGTDAQRNRRRNGLERAAASTRIPAFREGSSCAGPHGGRSERSNMVEDPSDRRSPVRMAVTGTIEARGRHDDAA